MLIIDFIFRVAFTEKNMTIIIEEKYPYKNGTIIRFVSENFSGKY